MFPGIGPLDSRNPNVTLAQFLVAGTELKWLFDQSARTIKWNSLCCILDTKFCGVDQFGLNAPGSVTCVSPDGQSLVLYSVCAQGKENPCWLFRGKPQGAEWNLRPRSFIDDANTEVTVRVIYQAVITPIFTMELPGGTARQADFLMIRTMAHQIWAKRWKFLILFSQNLSLRTIEARAK